MFGYFYHEKIRKCVAIFGKLFNNIYVIRKNASGESISQVKVPLSYAPKRKFLDRLREQPDLVEDTKVAIKLPRMSFEIVNFAYDNARQLTKTNSVSALSNVSNSRRKFFTPVPYNINFQLNIYAKSQDDALQMVEQIVPFFNPQYTLTINPFPEIYPELKEDIPIIIQGVSFSDDFEGQLETRRTIMYALDFEMKINFYGPITDNDIIRKAKTIVYDIGSGFQDSDIPLERLTTTPDPVDVFGSEDSDFGFLTDVERFYDSG